MQQCEDINSVSEISGFVQSAYHFLHPLFLEFDKFT